MRDKAEKDLKVNNKVMMGMKMVTSRGSGKDLVVWQCRKVLEGVWKRFWKRMEKKEELIIKSRKKA